jgi:hypothetical protein
MRCGAVAAGFYLSVPNSRSIVMLIFYFDIETHRHLVPLDLSGMIWYVLVYKLIRFDGSDGTERRR